MKLTKLKTDVVCCYWSGYCVRGAAGGQPTREHRAPQEAGDEHSRLAPHPQPRRHVRVIQVRRVLDTHLPSEAGHQVSTAF